MPKIVDRDAYRAELASKATDVFRRHGYAGIGMRQIARELGLSKSALYHYFPSKVALFAACTEHAVGIDLDIAHKAVEEARKDGRDALTAMASALEPSFRSDVSLVLEYARDLTPDEVARDNSLQRANDRYLQIVAGQTGRDDAKPVLCLLLGAMLLRVLDGDRSGFGEIAAWLHEKDVAV